MELRGIYSLSIDSIFNNINSDKKKTFVFFKGFTAEFFSELESKKLDSLYLDLYINHDRSIDVELLEKNKNLLLIKFIQNSLEGVTWGYYEELIALCSMLNEIEKSVNADFIVVDNNLFQNCYPISVDDKILKKLVNYINNEEVEDEELEIFMNYYSNVVAYSNDSFGVTYKDKDNDFNFKKVNFYNYKYDNIVITDTSITENIITQLNLFELKDNIQKNKEVKKYNLILDDRQETEKLHPLIYLSKSLNINFNIICNNKFSNLVEIEDDKYLPILKRYWGRDKEFRKIKFYKNPDESNDVIDISQGHIISDIINQAEKALKNEEDFRDIFVTAPTGAGKSILFQIPAIHLALHNKAKAVTIVITPLIALMRDQVEQLKNERGIDFATFLNSEISFEEKEIRIRKIRNGEISIVYMAPELLLSTSIENIIGNSRRIGLLVVDEAHIVTTWGRDFRADYWFLGSYIEKLRLAKEREKNFPIVCLTATAVYMGTEDTVNETIKTLALIAPKLYLGNVRRKNICFDINLVDRKSISGGFEEFKLNKSHERVIQFLSQNKKTIVYCPFTTQIEQLSNLIDKDSKLKVGSYYGTYDKSKKIEAQRKFKNGEYKVMLCTKAFGMGIDISDIEKVYHYAPTGNLSDYVQEIGRVARDENITGYAVTDFTTSDLKYIRMLNSLSSIRQYQLKEVLRKMYSIYKEKKKRNLLISPETFSYLFGEDNLENKVKTSLLLLEKDINKQFNVLVVRPKSIFSKNFVNVPTEIEEEFMKKYGQYAKRVIDNTTRIIPGWYKNGDITINNSGTIYEVNMSEIWENNFSDITFPDFKRRFFNGELFKFNNELVKLSARVHLTITYKEDYTKCKESLKDYCNRLSSVFSYFKRNNTFFTKNEFKNQFEKVFSGTFATNDLSDIILDMFVADTAKNVGFNQNSDKYKFIQERKSQSDKKSMELEYRVMNSNYTTLSSYMVRQVAQCEPNTSVNSHSAYIAVTNGDKRTDILQLAIILELFGLGTYEVIGGKNTEIFVRINDPLKINKLYNQNYRNEILTEIEKKRKKSQEVLQHFMSKKLSDYERWDIIENYFLGNEEYVFGKLGV